MTWPWMKWKIMDGWGWKMAFIYFCFIHFFSNISPFHPFHCKVNKNDCFSGQKLVSTNLWDVWHFYICQGMTCYSPRVGTRGQLHSQNFLCCVQYVPHICTVCGCLFQGVYLIVEVWQTDLWNVEVWNLIIRQSSRTPSYLSSSQWTSMN